MAFDGTENLTLHTFRKTVFPTIKHPFTPKKKV